MLSDHNEKYSDRMERSYKAFAVTFELRFPFPLNFDKCHYICCLPAEVVVVIVNFIYNRAQHLYGNENRHN